MPAKTPLSILYDSVRLAKRAARDAKNDPKLDARAQQKIRDVKADLEALFSLGLAGALALNQPKLLEAMKQLDQVNASIAQKRGEGVVNIVEDLTKALDLVKGFLPKK